MAHIETPNAGGLALLHALSEDGSLLTLLSKIPSRDFKNNNIPGRRNRIGTKETFTSSKSIPKSKAKNSDGNLTKHLKPLVLVEEWPDPPVHGETH